MPPSLPSFFIDDILLLISGCNCARFHYFIIEKEYVFFFTTWLASPTPTEQKYIFRYLHFVLGLLVVWNNLLAVWSTQLRATFLPSVRCCSVGEFFGLNAQEKPRKIMEFGNLVDALWSGSVYCMFYFPSFCLPSHNFNKYSSSAPRKMMSQSQPVAWNIVFKDACLC